MVKRNRQSELKPKKKLKRSKLDEEILSEPSDEEHLEENDDFFEAEETAEDTKLRLAKQLIQKAEEVTKDVQEGEDAVGKLLEDASVSYILARAKGKTQRAYCRQFIRIILRSAD